MNKKILGALLGILILQLPSAYAVDYINYFTTTTAWTTNDSAKINIDTVTNQRLDFNFVRDATIDAGVIDLQNGAALGSNLSNTAFMARFKYVETSMTVGSTVTKHGYIGFSDTLQTSDATNGDGLYFKTQFESDAYPTTVYQVRDYDGGVAGTTAFTLSPSGSITYYVELIRLSATSFKITLYSDSNFTTVVEAQTHTIASTIQGLRYLKISNFNGSSTTGSLVGYIDDLQICNNVTAWCDSPVNIVTYLRTVPSGDRMYLAWEYNATGANGADGYKIEVQSTMQGAWSTLVADTGSTTQTYTHTGLGANTWKNYRVYALNGTSISAQPSNESNNYTLEDPNACLIPGAIWVY